MDLLQLGRFVPIIIGGALIIFLLFRQGPIKDFQLGKLLLYFVGILLSLFFVGWLVDTFVFAWPNDRLQATTTGEFDTLVNSTEAIINTSMNSVRPAAGSGSSSITTQPPIVIVVTPVPEGQPLLPNSGGNASGATQYTVVAGDTLYSIAPRFGTTVSDIMAVNGLTDHLIYPGQVLLITTSPR
jgi:LysM repeat protein